MTVLDRPSVDLDAPLKAMPDTLSVRVLREDLEIGQPGNPDNCAISRATRRALLLGGYGRHDVAVCANFVSARPGPAAESVIYRHDGYGLVTHFDLRLPVEPCTVTLRRSSAAW